MKFLFSISFIIFIQLVPLSASAKNLSENAHDFELYQKTFSRHEIQKKIDQTLMKDIEVKDHFSIDESALYIYASLADKQNFKPEFTFYFGSKPKVKNSLPQSSNPHLPLRGLRIAIDPGHIGGDFAKIEEKYVHILPNQSKSIFEEIYFCEGDLALMTAKKLAGKLELLGAKVFLTRSAQGQILYKRDFDLWLKEDFQKGVAQAVTLYDSQEEKAEIYRWWNQTATSSQIFRLAYNFFDVERRAELINAFNPHLTVSCHYNLSSGYNEDGFNSGTDADYAFYFVGGAFEKPQSKNEPFAKKSLIHAETRYEFIRCLVTDDIEQSQQLAKHAIAHTKKHLKTKILNSRHPDFGIRNEEGIYHRNLCLLKLVHGPVLYGEPLLQDNFSNAKVLSSNPEAIVDKITHIYSEAILDWVNQDSEVTEL